MKREAKGEPQPETPSPAGATAPAKPGPYDLNFTRRPKEIDRDALARGAIRTTVWGAMTIKEYGAKYGDKLEVMGLVNALSDEAKKAADGDLARGEHMLMVQAHTLDAVFNTLAGRAALNFGEHFEYAERYLRLALKAQSQCRATLETLALMKNPAPVAFVRQANIGHAVQVNNGPAPAGEPSRAGETENQQNELSGSANELLSDTRAPALAGRADPRVEPVGAVIGTEDSSGKGASKPERGQGRDATTTARAAPGVA